MTPRLRSEDYKKKEQPVAARSLPLWREKERRQGHEGVNANDGNLFLGSMRFFEVVDS